MPTFNIKNVKNASELAPGTRILIDEHVNSPIVLTGLRGTYEDPIVIERSPKVVISLPSHDPAREANLIAWKRQEGGFFPSVGQVADQAALVLSDCQFVQINGLKFKNCWPTAIYLDRSQNIAVTKCKFKGGTVAIGANGLETRDILIEECRWRQTKPGEMWDTIAWEAIHGSYENAQRGVDVENDQRQYDGDFFRAWDIGGNITIRGNHIADAFNGIHFFNSIDALPPGVDGDAIRFNNGRRSANNVLIESNRFVRVRDNCIEPEDHAWNWVVRSNVFEDCYAIYSFELDRGGWFYIYDNHHWILNRPGKDTGSNRTGGSGFKSGGDHDNEGDIYVFNNSWLFGLGERMFRKGHMGRVKHYNNAAKIRCEESNYFGKNWSVADGPNDCPENILKAEKKRFTRRWEELEIEMNGDWIYDKNSPEQYREAGYALGPDTKRKSPSFSKPTGPKNRKILKPGNSMKKAGACWKMRLPGFDEAQRAIETLETNPYEWYVPKDGPVGAGLSEQELKLFEERLTFVPDAPLRLKGKKRKKKAC